jgi:soluble lytic murein transglycosylase
MIRYCSVLNIPVRWHRRALAICALAAACSPFAFAETLENLALAYRKNPRPQTRAAVLKYASAHPKDADGALALLVLSATEIDQRQFGDALQHATAAEKRLPKLSDYAGFLNATAAFNLRQFGDVEPSLKPVWQSSPPSPLQGKAVGLLANAWLENKNPRAAIDLVQKHLADLPESQAEDLLARAYEMAGDTASATAHYQRIFVEYPLSAEASDAEAAMDRLPRPDAKRLLSRCFKLIDGGDYSRARKQLEALVPSLDGNDRDLARVRIGVTRYQEREYQAAYTYLKALEIPASDADQERLYYVAQCARRLDKEDEMNAALDQLSRSYAQSHWRLEGLTAVAGYYALRNQPEKFEPLYRACYESFPADSQAASCQWKTAWQQYLRDQPAAASMFEAHLRSYPGSENTTAALYFLGRIEEAKGERAGAHTYYERLSASFPNYYYSMLARERLKDSALATAENSPAVSQLLAGIKLVPGGQSSAPALGPVTKSRIDRARLLASAGLDDLATGELRLAAKNDPQQSAVAIELAELANRRDQPDLGIRYIKRFAPGYLLLPVDRTNDKLWKLAFPIPYRKPLEDYSREYSLDPFLVAALVRQESEFNARAVSRSNAYGLAQVLPSTGRQLSRKLGMRGFRSSMLFQPDTNLRMGTYYLRSLLDQLQGQSEQALASYNAGKRHVTTWLTWSQFREPAEFVESIPFNETRNYVQTVLRNADVYRRLYGNVQVASQKLDDVRTATR